MEFIFLGAIAVAVILAFTYKRKPPPPSKAQLAVAAIGLALAAAAVVAISVAVIKWSEIEEWIHEEELASDAVAQLVRKRIASGDVTRVEAGIYRNNKLIRGKAWESSRLDPELSSMFGSSDKIIIHQ